MIFKQKPRQFTLLRLAVLVQMLEYDPLVNGDLESKFKKLLLGKLLYPARGAIEQKRIGVVPVVFQTTSKLFAEDRFRYSSNSIGTSPPSRRHPSGMVG